MNYKGIIISGTDNSKNKIIAQSLTQLDNFKVSNIYSSDISIDGIKHNSEENFSANNDEIIQVKLDNGNETVFVHANDFMQTQMDAKIPIIICPRSCLKQLLEMQHLCLMSFFIYSDLGQNDELDLNRKLIDLCNYGLINKNMDDVCSLIIKLWDIRNTGGGLSRDIIYKMLRCGLLFRNGKEKNVSNASYDLSLGDEYYYGGKIQLLSDHQPFISIEPYDYVIASCEEKIALPRDVSARFDVSVGLFCQGIILSNSTQVDPGFEGTLFCLLFNTSNKAVYLKRHMHYTTLEFNKLVEPTTPYQGIYKGENSIVPYLPTNVLQGAINELKKEIELLKNESKKTQSLFLSVLALLITVMSIFIVLK